MEVLITENTQVMLKLVCPTCGGAIWESTDDGEFRCVECGDSCACEVMVAVTEEMGSDS